MTSDSEKVPTTQEAKQKYQKEDLVWEAVRRNELYKKDYNDLLKTNYKDIPKWERLQWNPNANYRWRIGGLLDPKIDIDEIKKAIALGEEPAKVHPHYFFYQEKRYPVIQFEVPGSLFNHNEMIYKHTFVEGENDSSTLCIKKDVLEDRLIISVDPTADEAIIRSEILQIKKKAVKIIAEFNISQINYNDRDDFNIKKYYTPNYNKRHYNPKDIDSYIEWLRMYDKINSNYMRKNPNKCLISQEGVLKLPEERGLFQQLVPDSNKEADKILNDVRKWKGVYQKAIHLIQIAPNIVFTTSRIQG